MCGIVGMAGNLNSSHSKMFRDMLVFDYVRGVDSTGVAMVPLGNTGHVTVEKELGHPGNLWDWGTSKLLNDRGIAKTLKRAMIGHNRAATIGNVTSENAHPFTYGDITGVHNGSLRNWCDLEGYVELDVDSKAIYNTINLKGIDHCWKSFTGAAALVFWDSKKQTLSIIRNEERPLWIAHSEKEDAIFWASEYWMLTVAASRNNVKLKMDSSGNKPKIWQPKENYLHVYKPTGTTCPLVEGRELEKKAVSTTTSGVVGGHSVTRTSTHHTPRVRSSGSVINAWAQGYAKAGKEMVGQRFKFIKTLKPFGVNQETNYYVVGETESGDRVKIFPATSSERDYWETCADLATDGDLWFKMTSRPRIEYLIKANKPEFYCYRISSDNVEELTSVEMSKFSTTVSALFNRALDDVGKSSVVQLDDYHTTYKTWAGSATKRRWTELLAETSEKGCCKACSDPIDIQEHLDILWMNKYTVLCPVCAKQDDTVQLIKSMGAR